MGGSRKTTRTKRASHAKQRVGVRKSRKERKASSKPPAAALALAAASAAAGGEAGWDVEATLRGNYGRHGLLRDPNPSTGRGGRGGAAPLAEDEAALGAPSGVAPGDLGEELRGALGVQREAGPRAPARLTSKQVRVVAALVAAHGDDVEAMRRDRKLNPMQHSAGQLRKLVDGFHAHPDLQAGDGGSRDFRAPKLSAGPRLHKASARPRR